MPAAQDKCPSNRHSPYVRNRTWDSPLPYSIVDKILNVMAPIKLLNRKEIGISMKPWLTKVFLKFIDKRDKLHKFFITEVRPDIKNYLHNQYKSYRNLLITLQRVSKKNYYAEYYRVNAENASKTWSDIKDIIKISKSST